MIDILICCEKLFGKQDFITQFARRFKGAFIKSNNLKHYLLQPTVVGGKKLLTSHQMPNSMEKSTTLRHIHLQKFVIYYSDAPS